MASFQMLTVGREAYGSFVVMYGRFEGGKCSRYSRRLTRLILHANK